MSWTTPITWTTSQVVTAANLNTHVRDNENFLRGFHGARLWESGALSQTANGANQLVTWDIKDYDTDTIASITTEDFVMPTGFGGYWRVDAQIQWGANATGNVRTLVLKKNETYATRAPNGVGTVLETMNFAPNGLAGSAVFTVITWQGPLVATDRITLEANQNSGGSLAFGTGKDIQWMSCQYLGS